MMAESEPAGMGEQAFLTVTAARARYGRRAVLDGVDLAVSAGEVFVLLGPNGAGKSTLVRAISGHVPLTSGTVAIGGRDPARSAAARRDLGIVPQKIALYEKLTAGENLAIMGRLMGLPAREARARVGDVLALLSLGDREGERVERLSGGMRRRINIGAALMHRPRLLILDEPTVGVDFMGRRGVRDLLHRLRDDGLAILLTTHEMDEADALADRVGVILAGRIRAQGTPHALLAATFGRAQEVSVRLNDSETESAGAPPTHVTALGLTLDRSTGLWRGLVDASEPDQRAALQALMTAEAPPAEIRVRRPGLDTLMAQLIAEADRTPAAERERVAA